MMEEKEEKEVYDEAKDFLEEVKGLIHEAIKMNKRVEYKSDSLLILSLKDETHGVFEVYKINEENNLIPKLIYVGDKGLRRSYLLNLINKEEQRSVYKERYNR